MVGANYVTINTLAMTRSYSTLKENWRYLRMNAFENLENYIQSKNSVYYKLYTNDIYVLKAYIAARNEMLKPNYNRNFVIHELETHNSNVATIQDIPRMIKLIRLIHNTPKATKLLNLWKKGDQYLVKLDSIGTSIHTNIQSGKINEQFLSAEADSITVLNNRIIMSRNALNTVSNETAEWFKHLLWLITLIIGGSLLLIGGVSTTFVLRSSRQMRKTIEENEQRFRSLFDNNPNAVFLNDLNGLIINSNNAAVNLTGYRSDELTKMKLEHIIIPEHRKQVRENFEKAARGIPDHFEVNCESRDNHTLTIELTYIPIYVNGKCTGVFGVAEDITARKIQEKRIRDTLNEKEILLSEIHHRVKNNLALINGLLDLQVIHADKPELSDILADAQRRVHSMAKVHEMLYRETSFSQINLKSYIDNLTDHIASTFFHSRQGIQFDIDADELQLSINKAIPLGLILNELITNAYKHSFTDNQKGTIYIRLKKEDGKYSLSVLSDGNPLPEDFDPDNYQTMGITLIRTLSIQINARIEVINGKKDGLKICFSPDET